MSPKGYKYEPSGQFEPSKEESDESKVIAEQKTEREDIKPTVLLSQADAYIYDRLKEQPKSMDEVKVMDRNFEEMTNPLKLPQEVEKAFKKRNLTSRWVMKNPRSIARAIDVRKWVFANKVLFPELPKHLFTANGTIENGDLILMFMPEADAKALRELPGKISSEKTKNLPIDKWKEDEKGERYFKPTLSTEKDGEVVTADGIRSVQIEQ